jgi:hypothetical protein
MSETQLVSAILAALALEPGVVAWRNNTGMMYSGGRAIRYGLGKGSPDIVCCVAPWGRFLGLEAKVEDGALSADQGRWRDAVRRGGGGSYYVVRSVADARRAVIEARRLPVARQLIETAPEQTSSMPRTCQHKSRSVTRRR